MDRANSLNPLSKATPYPAVGSLMDYMELTDCEPKAILDYRPGIKWVNICSDIESFREYRQRGRLSFRQWLDSLKGEKLLSDLAGDDILPGLREILFENILRRSGRYAMKLLKFRST